MKDTFRKSYRPLSDKRKDDLFILKELAEKIEQEFDLMETYEDIDKRCLALARTNLEQSVMWAIKAIT